MIYYVDNFLPQDQFDALAKRVQSGFRGDTSSLVENSDEPLRVTHHDHSGDWEEALNFLKKACHFFCSVFSKISGYFVPVRTIFHP